MLWGKIGRWTVKKLKEKEEVNDTEYEIELSDKSPLTSEDLDEIVGLAEKYKWTKEEADAYISKREGLYNRGYEDLRSKASEILKAEKAKLLADPDFKGDKLPISLKTIDSVISKYGDPELKTYMKGPGGNSLSLNKFLLKIGSLMESDTPKGKGIGGNPSNEGTRESALQKMYPSFFE